jgi:hypothetical protein
VRVRVLLPCSAVVRLPWLPVRVTRAVLARVAVAAGCLLACVLVMHAVVNGTIVVVSPLRHVSRPVPRRLVSPAVARRLVSPAVARRLRRVVAAEVVAPVAARWLSPAAALR